MQKRTRIASFGGTACMVLAGAVCTALFSSEAGQLVGFSLIGVGLILATGLVFLEVGLSEDRERAREQEAAARAARAGRGGAAPTKRGGRGFSRSRRRPD